MFRDFDAPTKMFVDTPTLNYTEEGQWEIVCIASPTHKTEDLEAFKCGLAQRNPPVTYEILMKQDVKALDALARRERGTQCKGLMIFTFGYQQPLTLAKPEALCTNFIIELGKNKTLHRKPVIIWMKCEVKFDLPWGDLGFPLAQHILIYEYITNKPDLLLHFLQPKNWTGSLVTFTTNLNRLLFDNDGAGRSIYTYFNNINITQF